MKILKIGICGWGNVATGLFNTIKLNYELIQSNGNLDIEIVVIGARRDNPKCDPGEVKIERNIFDVIDHEIDVVVELIGGVEVARELILKAISETLKKGERIEVRGFGSLSTRIRKPIRGRNPKSGEAIELSERKVPYFRASKELNQKLN